MILNIIIVWFCLSFLCVAVYSTYNWIKTSKKEKQLDVLRDIRGEDPHECGICKDKLSMYMLRDEGIVICLTCHHIYLLDENLNRSHTWFERIHKKGCNCKICNKIMSVLFGYPVYIYPDGFVVPMYVYTGIKPNEDMNEQYVHMDGKVYND